MEKVNPRTSSSKSNTSDAKVKQDVTNKHLRLPRVKESVSPRPEARRKPNPQRNRELFDKRPRNKAGAVCERYRSEVDESMDDGYSKHGGKKMNLNHLLNFTLAPLEHKDVGIRRHGYNRNKYPKYNKEQFLQANCQFVARDNGNYSVHEKNPDIIVEWPLIEEIRLPSHEVPLCPICLYSPIAAKITKCGHIYCWPCMLHYLALTDRTWQKCPICFEAVHKNELKSVSLRIQKSFSVGDEITMCLMKREKGSLFPIPVAHENPKQVCNVNSDDDIARFQKLLLASKKDISAIISRERFELEEAFAQEKDTPEACFIESALKLLGEREHGVNEEIPLTSVDDKQAVSESGLVSDHAYQRNHLESISSTDSHEEMFAFESGDQCSDVNLPENNSKCSSPGTPDLHPDLEKKGNSYFYQAEDGQHIYMHNINVRMLLKECGSLENAPPIIKAKIVEIDSVSMTDNLRKRLRYLQHLPLTCEFQVVELNFSRLLKKSTLLLFEAEINKRKHFRNRKAQNERRRERFIEQEENKKMGKYPKATFNLQSIDQFPSCQSDFQPLSPPKYGNNSEEAVLHSSSNDPVINSTVEGNNNPSLIDCYSPTAEIESTPSTSFAQMLKDGPKTFTQIIKEKKKVEIESPRPLNLNTDSDGENAVPPPEYRQSFSDAIQAALESVSLQEPTDNCKKPGKKKRGKKQLLFTTSMCRNK